MLGAQQKRIREAGLSSIDPMHHVMRIKPSDMSTSRIAATLIAAQQCSFQLRGNNSVFPPHIERLTIYIFGHSHEAAFAAKSTNGFDRQFTLATFIAQR
tara:strand:- start:206 stop:502 length:297 start_codon:yes stop_codon:yes gene_type:complete